MAKRKTTTPELSKIEKFYIEKNCTKLTIDEICTDLQSSSDAVSAFYQSCVDKNAKADTIDKMMVVDSKNGYVVMTKGASEKGEQTRRRSENKALSEHIHKIR